VHADPPARPCTDSTDVLRAHRRPNPIARTLNRLTSPDNGPDFTLTFHRWLYRKTDGRLGHGLIGAPTLLLSTTGRRSGRRRTTPVVYVRSHGRAVIGATNGGRGNPGWYHNLTAAPRVEMQIGRQRVAATASTMNPSHPDYAALWQELDRVTHGRFAAYESRSGEAIPLVVLDPDA
jgi:deazaflavin-dependent oxidoreductase (nitroreductase family)